MSYPYNSQLVIACAYSLHVADLRNKLDALSKRLGLKLHGIIVSNHKEALPSNDSDWNYIHGSNSDHDFSAYIEGLKHCLALNEQPPSSILFINDSLFSIHSAYANAQETLKYRDLVEKLQVPAICGKADKYLTLCHQNPWSRLNLYISTYCFLLNSIGMNILLNLPSLADADGIDRNLAISDEAWGVNLPAAFREFIRAFLLYGHPSFVWPGLGRYSTDAKLISTKARCIYLEHRLSGEIGKHGCVIPNNVHIRANYRLYLSEKLASLRCSILNLRKRWI
ncbi:hypothetical protein [Methylovorus sp. MP688]|uniref:hypothetical protein n=1 Tax=Methylovorus sp. (strain MP688) TaxID=887061 RepID=UPI0011D0821D|nr:hypothetical protein [Methylovorus sp. MP688]